MKKIRPMGDILLDLEEILTEMVEVHELQFGDVLSLVYSYLEVHHPGAKEEYIEGGHPEFYYGPKGVKNGKR